MSKSKISETRRLRLVRTAIDPTGNTYLLFRDSNHTVVPFRNLFRRIAKQVAHGESREVRVTIEIEGRPPDRLRQYPERSGK